VPNRRDDSSPVITLPIDMKKLVALVGGIFNLSGEIRVYGYRGYQLPNKAGVYRFLALILGLTLTARSDHGVGAFD